MKLSKRGSDKEYSEHKQICITLSNGKTFIIREDIPRGELEITKVWGKEENKDDERLKVIGFSSNQINIE